MQVQQVVDEIRGVLNAAQPSRLELVASLADQYATACESANARLRRCTDALRRGLRSDAIKLSEAEPNLLDLVAALDFPEVGDWQRLCAARDLPQPPALLIEQAAELNEAYAAEQPLETLLAHHRLMALARAPLGERIRVMRRIANLDPASPFWDEDIRAFERARVEQMREQLRAATRSADAAAVDRLNQEASDTSWRETVPADLRTSLTNTAAHLTATRSLAELRELLPKLNDAYGAMSYPECKSLLGQWLAIVAGANLTLPPELQEQVSPIVEWVRSEDTRREQQASFESACDTLQQAIDADQPTPALERAYRATHAFDLSLPNELENSYHQRIATRAMKARHRRIMVLSGIGAAFVLVAGTLVFIGYEHLLNREVADAQTTLAEVLDETRQGQLDQAQALRKRLFDEHPRVLRSAAIASANVQIDQAVAAEQQRRSSFFQHMQAATAAGAEQPDETDLQQASALAKLPSETEQVQQLSDQIAGVNAKRQAANDRQFTDAAKKISAEMSRSLTADQITADSGAFTQSLGNLSDRVKALGEQANVSTELRSAQLAALNGTLEQARQQLQHYRTAQDLLQQLSRASSASRHMALLKQFVSTCPDDPRCVDFNQALAHADADQAIEDWAADENHWAGDFDPSSLELAKSRAGELADYINTHRASPVRSQASAYLEYIQSGLTTLSADGPWQTSFRKLIDNPLVRDLKCLQTKDGSVYFVTNGTTVHNHSDAVTFEAVTSPDLSNLTPESLPVDSLTSTTPTDSPQALFSREAARTLEELSFKTWTTVGFDFCDKLVQQPGMNPILRGILLQRVIQMNQTAAVWAQQEKYKNVSDALTDQNVDDIAWLDPAHAPGSDTVQRLQAAWNLLPPPGSTQAAATKRRNHIFDALQLHVVGEGVLLRQNDHLTIGTSTAFAAGQTAWAIGPDDQLVQVGKVVSNEWAVDSLGVPAPAGSLVFIRSVPTSSPR